MKKIIFGLLLYFAFSALPQQASAQRVSVSFQVFYDELSPYGNWVNNPSYGYVWVPNVGYGFQPYSTDGNWTYTEVGWTWVSNYPWGWAPFHYGRWYYDDFYGYVWVPGNQWGPAWVTWRRCDGFYGWTPLAPGYGYGYGVSYVNYNPPAERWIFVHERDFGRTNINNYYVDKSTNVTIINKSTVIQNSEVNKSRNEIYIAGPPRAQVEKVTGRDIKPKSIDDSKRPETKVDNDRVEMFRPEVVAAENGRKPAPQKVATRDEIKPIIEKQKKQRQSAAPSNGTPNRSNIPANEQRRTVPAAPSRQAEPVQQQRRDNVPAARPSQAPVQQRQIPQQREAPAQRQNPVQRQQPVRQAEPVQRQQPVQRQAPVQRQQPVQQPPVQRQQAPANIQRNVPQSSPPIQRSEPVQQQRQAPPQRTMPAQQPRNDFRQSAPRQIPSAPAGGRPGSAPQRGPR